MNKNVIINLNLLDKLNSPCYILFYTVVVA
jgi:hypothetical protein